MTPFHTHERGPLYRLQGIDASLLGAPALYLAGNSTAPLGGLPMALAADDWLGSGTLRNSFYVEPWAQLTAVGELWLALVAEGSLRVRVMRACPGQAVEVLREFQVDSRELGCHAQRVGVASEMLAASRLFWHIDAIDGGVVHDVAWCTRTAPQPDCRLAVLMRTFGRAAALRSLLWQFADAAATHKAHAEALGRIDFWVLDSSEGPLAAEWQEARDWGLSLRLISAPNLGGGGNASHLIHLFLESQKAEKRPAEELLILDDDLSLSMESLARYLSFCAYRTQDVVCSLPVLMKSQPTQVWEDGGFWGRQGFEDAGDGRRQRGLAPHLLRHGMALGDFAHLDEFATLNRCEYATFIFYGLPRRVLAKIGLPAALFLRGDDVELSLRAGAAGVPVVTNPNLAAWHEPAHSHGQEYMAILHGIIINLAWTDDGADTYVAWFEQRMAEHALLGDALGLSVYQAVLQDLMDSGSALLGLAFETHYPPRLALWRGASGAPLSALALERLAKTPSTRWLPFLYPGLHARGLQPGQRVWLRDASGEAYRELPESTATERLALMQDFAATLLRFQARFDALRAHWRERLRLSGQPEFWASVAERHRAQTKTVFISRFVAPPSPPLSASATVLAPAAPVRELRERLERERLAVLQMRRELAGPQPQASAAPSKRLWWRRLWGPGMRAGEPIPADSPSPPLPPDFDPQLYLSLHQDVARSGVDPTRHYLTYGRSEGRRYRL